MSVAHKFLAFSVHRSSLQKMPVSSRLYEDSLVMQDLEAYASTPADEVCMPAKKAVCPLSVSPRPSCILCGAVEFCSWLLEVPASPFVSSGLWLRKGSCGREHPNPRLQAERTKLPGSQSTMNPLIML